MDRRIVIGLCFAIGSAAAFGISGPLARGLLDAGWSPAAAVTWRVAIGALILMVPAIRLMRGRWHTLRQGWRAIVSFGLLAVAGCQLSFFFAVERLSVGVALLLEYLGILLVVSWLWLRHGQRPRPLTVLGAGLAVAGLILVLDAFGSIEIDMIGVFWGLAAAVGLAAYFVLAANESHGLPPLVLAAGGLATGAAALAAAGTIGLVSMQTSTADVQLAGTSLPWWFNVVGLALVAAALAYATGVAATRRLGSKLASFVGLSEVLFAVVFAWLLLGELPAAVQIVGGGLILAGVVAVKLDERAPAVVAADPLPLTGADLIDSTQEPDHDRGAARDAPGERDSRVQQRRRAASEPRRVPERTGSEHRG